ncbi:hypothetical protein LXL04_008925 [Taraxacum kok-saghyz]
MVCEMHNHQPTLYLEGHSYPRILDSSSASGRFVRKNGCKVKCKLLWNFLTIMALSMRVMQIHHQLR